MSPLFTGMAAQSTSRQHASCAVSTASGQSLIAPPSAQRACAPVAVSSPAPQAHSTSRLGPSHDFIGEIVSPSGGSMTRSAVAFADETAHRNVGDALRDQLGDVEDLDLVLDVLGLHAVGQHDVAEGAGDRDGIDL